MPTMPLMPSGADEVATPMSGGMPPAPPMPPMGGGDLTSLLSGGGPSTMGLDPVQAGMRQFDQLTQMVADMARMFPGSEQSVQQVMEAIEMWMQDILVMMTPQPSSMPGADTMM